MDAEKLAKRVSEKPGTDERKNCSELAYDWFLKNSGPNRKNYSGLSYDDSDMHFMRWSKPRSLM
jgi:hypothetical protein